MNNIEFIDGMNKAWDLAFRLIGEDKDGWIPVEERLPEDKQQVLVTNWDYCVVLARYDENEKRFIDIRNGLVLPLILAWMPLPKPYKEKGE